MCLARDQFFGGELTFFTHIFTPLHKAQSPLIITIYPNNPSTFRRYETGYETRDFPGRWSRTLRRKPVPVSQFDETNVVRKLKLTAHRQALPTAVAFTPTRPQHKNAPHLLPVASASALLQIKSEMEMRRLQRMAQLHLKANNLQGFLSACLPALQATCNAAPVYLIGGPLPSALALSRSGGARTGKESGQAGAGEARGEENVSLIKFPGLNKPQTRLAAKPYPHPCRALCGTGDFLELVLAACKALTAVRRFEQASDLCETVLLWGPSKPNRYPTELAEVLPNTFATWKHSLVPLQDEQAIDKINQLR